MGLLQPVRQEPVLSSKFRVQARRGRFLLLTVLVHYLLGKLLVAAVLQQARLSLWR
jgi:hypothetical protein